MGDGERKILVVGGGISGMTAAIEAAETGAEVVLVEKNPYLGGRVAQLNQYFPKLCPPSCGLEINFRRIKQNANITFHTLAEVQSISGGPGNYEVTVAIQPRYVNDNCTACGKCAEVCETEVPNGLNYDMDNVKAARLPHAMAFPFKYMIAPEIIGTDEATKCAEACPYGAVDLTMQPTTLTYNVGAVVWATGWDPYNAANVDYLGFGSIPNVITSVMFERLVSPGGPTGGKLLRPSDGKEVKSVAFVQCAGSRDENHLKYCSGVCCLASLKQATYLRERVSDGNAFIYYIDVRAMGKYEDFYLKVKQDENIVLTKSKIARITPDPETGGVIVEGEDIGRGAMVKQKVDLAVLAVGMVPGTASVKPSLEMEYDDFGFVTASGSSGIIPAGCVKAPMEVAASLQDATAAALKALQCSMGR
ncbi:CoB--CoM heterodisulfide reductase iron-sulfur subunit A family protein [Desulfomonile tiedjei]|uniref:FAD binding protein n=1 Tax=Desulfomonile tiedjei (strain ATCC 49306 / DSM 6799 / DCB-1) TaxID=706587 RepID=I4CAA7_DESTA|nr:CoB--CoM heterodisulfide reductase iron-sulfur subunit A family protein [Desulfomonile tiedjei]AFM26498.1 FAD binding protein [Desulfomonile tiedjei DSM 6799]